MFIELEKDNLSEILKSNKRVMVQYGAGWCGYKFKRLAEENESVEFVYVDAEKLPESRGFAEVNNLPTFAGFVDGELVSQSQGNKLETIKEVLNEITNN